MGNCKIKEIYDNSESQKEVNMDNNDNSIIKKFKKNNSNEKKNKKLKFFNKIKLHGKKEYNYKNGILENKKPNSNLNIIGNDNNLGNNDELIIITPRLNSNIASETYLNDITDEFTIKNETLVYINEYISNKESESKKSYDKKCDSDIHKIKNNNENQYKNTRSSGRSNKSYNYKNKINIIDKKNNNNNRNNIKNSNNQKQNISKNKSNIKNEKPNIMEKRNIPNNNNINSHNNEMYNNITSDADFNNSKNIMCKDNNQIIMKNQENPSINNTNKRNEKSKKKKKLKSNKSHNNYQMSNFRMNPLFESFQLSEIIKANNNPQSSTLQKQNIDLGNLLHQLPIINSVEILPNIERKTYKEDLELENDEQNIRGNNKKKELIPIFRKKTDFHMRNKSYNKYDFFNNNIVNDKPNDNNYFSLFDNSANLSINFIHNKFNKSSKNMSQKQQMVNNKKILSDRYNNSCINKNVNMNCFDKKEKQKADIYYNYNNFIKKNNPNKKVKNKSNIQKVKKGLSSSISHNNIFETNENNEFNKTNNNRNNMILASEQYQDMIEIYFPKINNRTLMCNEIKNKAGNKYIFSYAKLDSFNINQILYDGIIYKIIDDVESSESDYKLLDRYFQITKNSFKYYNNINEAINEKEKPLVQFDIRHIQNIEIIDNSFFEKSKINGNKKIRTIFCIYIKDNNDFFVFAHYNRYVGNNIINILQFLIRYYQDNY